MSIPHSSLPGFLALSVLALPLSAQSPIATRVPVFAPAKAAAVVAPPTAPLAGVPGDDCTAPIALPSYGNFAFDNSLATTSAVPSGACGLFGTNAMDHDLWFTWTSPSTGAVVVTTIGLTGIDSMLAIYAGSGCPTGNPIVCDDDACGTLQSSVFFTATAGASYTIQLGSFPGAIGGAGSFALSGTLPPPGGCAYDDGVSENSIGLTTGGQIAWMHRFGAPQDWTNVTDVSTAFGTAAFPGASPPNGTPAEIVVWDDTDDDGDPRTGLALVGVYPTTVQNVDTDAFVTTALSPAPWLHGVFFVGVSLTHAAGTLPAPFDTSGVCGGSRLSWLAGFPGGALDYTNLQAPGSILYSNEELGLGGLWLLRAGCDVAVGTPDCAGDGTLATSCPCANFGAPDHGCASSFNPAGASLLASGSVYLDDVVLHGSGMNATGSCIFLKGDGFVVSGSPFGDGVRCASGNLIRLRTVPLVGGSASFPDSTETITLSARGGSPVGSGLRAHYTVYYRNAAAAFCPPETFNASNGYTITWW
ncbi:MAG: hypothetical protein U1F29_13910 [Planctomycetota bacterium]